MGLVTLAVLFACITVAVAVEPADWQGYRSSIKALSNGQANSSVAAKLPDAMAWEFELPLQYMRQSQAYTGSRHRLRRVVADMLAGKPIEVAVLGGSVSTGAVASRKNAVVNPNDCWSLVRIWMQGSLGSNQNVEFINNARSATKSYAMSQCLPKFLNSTADLVFMEFVANDGSERDTTLTGNDKTRSYERFMRKILSQPKAPAVVQVQMLVEGQAGTVADLAGRTKTGFTATPEDTYYNLAQYYDVPTVSFRNTIYQMAENGRDGMQWSDFMGPDWLHPNDRGHKIMADMVVQLLQQTAIDLAIQPLSPADGATVTAPLPPPMFDGNAIGPLTFATCDMGTNLTRIAVGTDSWTMVSGGDNTVYPTYGYETTATGTPLTLELNTAVPGGRPAGVNLYYTKADSGFGGYEISCDNGCQCPPTYIYGTLPYPQQVTFVNTIQATGAPACHINIQMAANSTAGSRLRVTGVALSGDTGALKDTRIGEEKYMAWLFADSWAS